MEKELRDTWVFHYTAKVLAEAAAKQQKDREARRERWREGYKTVMAEAKENGIEISESESGKFSASAYGRGPQVMVRTDLQEKLLECHERIVAHDKAAKDYAGWVAVLSAHPEDRVTLTHKDWLYFFGGLEVETVPTADALRQAA